MPSIGPWASSGYHADGTNATKGHAIGGSKRDKKQAKTARASRKRNR